MRRTVTLSGAVFALLCLAMILFVLPAGAQDDSIPPGTRANAPEVGDGNDRPIVIVVAASGCIVSQDASITLEVDGETDDVAGTPVVFTNGVEGTTISSSNGRPRITVPSNDRSDNRSTLLRRDEDRDFLVVTSTGVSCEGDNAAQGQYGEADGDVVDGEVDEAEDVIVGTTSSKKIPNTGGPPLLVFGVLLLGLALVVGRGVLRP